MTDRTTQEQARETNWRIEKHDDCRGWTLQHRNGEHWLAWAHFGGDETTCRQVHRAVIVAESRARREAFEEAARVAVFVPGEIISTKLDDYNRGYRDVRAFGDSVDRGIELMRAALRTKAEEERDA